MVYTPLAPDYVIPVMTALDDIPALAITEQEAEKLRFGQSGRCDRGFRQQPVMHNKIS